MTVNPLLLPLRVLPNPVVRPQFGAGELVRGFRREQDPAAAAEDWTASDLRPRTARAGEVTGLGRVALGDGGTAVLADLIAAHPLEMLGETHARRWHGRLGVLAKLFDPDRRIPLHCHPSREFARAHLGGGAGKTEAWIVVESAGPGPNAWVGFSRDVDESELRELVDAQADLLPLMNPLTLRTGDVIVVPAGVPHALGPGLLVIEPQEPSDWSVLLEFQRYGLSREQAELGLGTGTALSCVERRAVPLASLEDHWLTRGVLATLAEGRTPLAAAARPFFSVEALRSTSRLRFPVGIPRVVIATSGQGVVSSNDGEEPVRPGDVIFLGGGIESAELVADGDLTVVTIAAGDDAPGSQGEAA